MLIQEIPCGRRRSSRTQVMFPSVLLLGKYIGMKDTGV
jgi:hypothetical protein